MRLLLLVSFFILGCGKVENSNSTDKIRYGGAVITGTQEFVAAATVIQAKCANCHTHSQWRNYSQAEYILNGLVVAKSPDDSPLFYRNKNTSSGPGPKDMPAEGKPSLTQDELTLITTWIASF